MTLRGVGDVLGARPYPGRGCVAARLLDGRLALAYFLTGRSAASRSRALVRLPSGDLQVKDTSGGAHDALRHYVAGVRRPGWTVVGNGDQVAPFADALAAGTDPATAWAAHTYEPDPPIFTPRIAVALREADSALVLASARRSDRSEGGADRLLVLPEALPAGEGLLLTTYDGTVDAVVPSGVATSVLTSFGSVEALAQAVWTSLDPALAVACFAALVDDLAAATLLPGAGPSA